MTVRERIEIAGEAYGNWRSCRNNEMPCIICGKPTRTDNRPWMIHVCNGGAWAHMDDDDHGDLGLSGCLGNYPIGNTCLKNHPELRPFARKD